MMPKLKKQDSCIGCMAYSTSGSGRLGDIPHCALSYVLEYNRSLGTGHRPTEPCPKPCTLKRLANVT